MICLLKASLMKLSNGKLAALVIALVIVIDQAVKIWVKTHFYYGITSGN